MIPQLFLFEFELLMDSLVLGGTGYLQSTSKPLASRVCACGMGCVVTMLISAQGSHAAGSRTGSSLGTY